MCKELYMDHLLKYVKLTDTAYDEGHQVHSVAYINGCGIPQIILERIIKIKQNSIEFN